MIVLFKSDPQSLLTGRLILVVYLRRGRITGIQTVINIMLLARTLRPFWSYLEFAYVFYM